MDSEYEDGKTSRRIKQAAAASARAGKPHGRIPYGYRREYRINERGRREFVVQVEEPAEAAVVRELFKRLHEGHSLRSIARDFAARGIRTRTGKLFDGQRLRDLALRPIYVGLRIHTAGNRSGRYDGPPTGAVKTEWWPALVEPEIFYAVRAFLQDSGPHARPGHGKDLLSMIATCGVCGGPLTVTYRYGEQRQYTCRDSSHVQIDADALDSHVENVMLAYLTSPDVIVRLRYLPEDARELTAVRGDLAAARAELDAWRAAAREGKIPADSFAVIEPGILARVAELGAREQELSTLTALTVISSGEDVARWWKAASTSNRQQVARQLCSPPFLGILRVDRPPGRWVDLADRVEWQRS